MTKDFIKRYMITLETEGPLFIGSGKELTKKEWIYDRKKKKESSLMSGNCLTIFHRKNL